MRIKTFVDDPRVRRTHDKLTAPDARRAREVGLLDRGVPRPPTDDAFGMTSPEVLKGIGHSTARKLQTLGIMTVSQLAHSVADLQTLGPQAASVIAVRAALKQTLNGKERARRDSLTRLRAIGDLPRRTDGEYRAAARRFLLDHDSLQKSGGLRGAALDDAIERALESPSVSRRTYLPDLETPVRAWIAEFDISAFSDEARLRVVHEGDRVFSSWTTA